MENSPKPDQPPEQPDGLNDPTHLQPEVSPDELNSPDAAARLAAWKEEQENWQAFQHGFIEDDRMSTEEKTRLLMNGGEARARLFIRLGIRKNPRSNRLFLPPPLEESDLNPTDPFRMD